MAAGRQLMALFFACALLVHQARCLRWLGLRSMGAQWNSTGACRRARSLLGLSRRQTLLCRGTPDAMTHVVAAAAAASTTCQQLFADRRWNCSSIDTAPHFTKDLTTGTREQAAAYALGSAALAAGVARACASGALLQCGCAPPPSEPPHGHFKWGGCGDNVRWAARFAKRFTDSAERRGALVAALNLHNNRAGRRAVEASVATQCKCHGVSGSCSVKTCWRALPRLLEVGARLRRKFARAALVVGRRLGAARTLLRAAAARAPYTADDLVYAATSPDYCLPDARVGSLGTHGRTCNASSQGYDSCKDMCCGRGYRTILLEKIERCHCKYYWCCYVKCKTCRRWVEVNECY